MITFWATFWIKENGCLELMRLDEEKQTALDYAVSHSAAQWNAKESSRICLDVYYVAPVTVGTALPIWPNKDSIVIAKGKIHGMGI